MNLTSVMLNNLGKAAKAGDAFFKSPTQWWFFGVLLGFWLHWVFRFFI